MAKQGPDIPALVRYFALNPAKRKPVTPADRFLEQFRAENLEKALRRSSRQPISLAWIIKELLGIYAASEDESLRIQILEKFRDMIALGASQQEELGRVLSAEKARAGKSGPDPFSGDTMPRLKVKRGA